MRIITLDLLHGVDGFSDVDQYGFTTMLLAIARLQQVVTGYLGTLIVPVTSERSIFAAWLFDRKACCGCPCKYDSKRYEAMIKK